VSGRKAHADQRADIAVRELDQADPQDERADGSENTGHVPSPNRAMLPQEAAPNAVTSMQ
jgi:hypothetical protein